MKNQYESVDVIGVGGMRGLERYVRHARRTRPTVVILDAGTNNLCSEHCEGSVVAADLHRIACRFAALQSVRHVVIGEVIRRGTNKVNFEEQRVRCNTELRRLADTKYYKDTEDLK